MRAGQENGRLRAGASGKWRRFVRNPRAFSSLLLLGAVFALSLVGGAFLPDPSSVADPAAVAPFRRLRVKVAPEVRVGRLDLRPDLTIASQVGCEAFAEGLRAGALLPDVFPLPPGFPEAVAARFGNLDSPALAVPAGGAELSLLPYAARAKAPRTVRVRVRDARPTSARPLSLVFARDAEGGAARPLRASRRAYAALCAQLTEEGAALLRARLAACGRPPPADVSATPPEARRPAAFEVVYRDGAKARVEVAGEPVAWPFRPVPGHPMGIDAAGRDVLSRVVAGTRTALLFGLALVASSMLLGIAAGAIQGYYGGAVDIVAQRFIEIWSALPFLYVMILVGSVLGRSFALLLLCYGLFNWIGVSYYMRAEFLRLRSRPFVEAARCQGLKSWRVIWRHILPNALTPVVTLLPFSLIGAVSSISALDFLGFGLPPLTPSLGELLGQAQQDASAWWLALYPSLVLFAIMLLAVFVGEGLRDAFDPKPAARYR